MTRAILTCLLVKRGPDGTQLVATDSFRMAEYTLPKQSHRKTVSTALIPGRAGKSLKRLLPVNANPEVLFSCKDQQGCFRWPGRELVTRLIERQFPHYERVKPDLATITTTIVVDPKVLAAAARRVGSIAYADKVIVTAKPGGAPLALSSENTDGASITVQVAAEVSGEPLEFAYAQKYLTETMAAFPVASVIWRLKDARSASLFTAEEYPHLCVVVMPMKL